MTCVQCTNTGTNSGNGKTLYDKTVARRVSGASRRSKRAGAAGISLVLFALGGAASLAPAQAVVQAADFSGFSTHAQATPLRVEIREPAIPIPQDPQAEMNFSYTKVDGASGPIGNARASALWPGDSVGEGLKTFGEQLSLPAALTGGGYPVQVNAQSPGDVGSATQEFFPGMTGKVSATDKAAIAKVGYGTAGDVSAGDNGSGSTPAAPNLLDALQSGDLSALGNALTGTQTAPPGAEQPSASPLGALALLINTGGMASISSTTYDATADSVVATATARLGNVALIAGIVELKGVEVITTVTSNIAGGAKIYRKVTIGSMSIAGNKFALTGDGIEAMGKPTPIPGLPDAPAAALKALGISFELGKATQTKTGPAGSVTAEGLRITIDTGPLRSKLPDLPLGDLINQLPDLPGQASIFKGLLLALTVAHPRIDMVLGQATASAQTVEGISETPGGSALPPDLPPTAGSVDPGLVTGPGPGELPPDTTLTPPTNTPGIGNTAFKLPGLGDIPVWMLLLGLAGALGVGWYIRSAGLLLFGGASTCAHGLRAGIPDLRKV